MGILLIHGFTGSPAEMRLVGDYLHERGVTVSAPLLPGHGTTARELNACTWQEWTAAVAGAAEELKGRCDMVFVAGLSLGSLLALHRAATDRDVAGVMLYSPAIRLADRRRHLIPFFKRLVPLLPKPPDDFADPVAASRLWSYPEYPTIAAHEVMKLIGQVRRRLPEVTQPLLIIHSTADRTIHPAGARYVQDHAGSADKTLVTLHACGHAITVDAEWRTVAEHTWQFVERQAEGAGRG